MVTIFLHYVTVVDIDAQCLMPCNIAVHSPSLAAIEISLCHLSFAGLCKMYACIS